jgi:hypothetical protein
MLVSASSTLSAGFLWIAALMRRCEAHPLDWRFEVKMIAQAWMAAPVLNQTALFYEMFMVELIMGI